MILLNFLAGKQTVMPFGTGVHEMNRHGRCSQGLVFPCTVTPLRLERADLQADWSPSMTNEKIAHDGGYTRWAVVPSLLQHIGSTSSKDNWFDGLAQRPRSYQNELYGDRC